MQPEHGDKQKSASELSALLNVDSASSHDVICGQLVARLLEPQGDAAWKLEVGTSHVPNGGDGVFLCGSCEAGTVLCCYPGVTFQPEDLPMMHQLVLPGNSYVVARRDGVLLDGRPDGPSVQIRDMARARDAAAQRAEPQPVTIAFAIGQKVNHPPGGTQPNVAMFPFDLREGEHPRLHPLLDIHHFRPPAPTAPVKQTAVFIAKRVIRDGEELFLDYKLRADGPGYEEWYCPVPPV